MGWDLSLVGKKKKGVGDNCSTLLGMALSYKVSSARKCESTAHASTWLMERTYSLREGLVALIKIELVNKLLILKFVR